MLSREGVDLLYINKNIVMVIDIYNNIYIYIYIVYIMP